MRGGEIFVPKIPSMRMVDLAKAMAPNLPYKTIGIRPGEKLHEVMITEDDARTTIEMDDRYIIKPAFAWWLTETPVDKNSKVVDEGFIYASNTNKQWLSEAELKEVIKI